MVRALGLAVALALLVPAAAQARRPAPGAPGAPEGWAAADKHGFGTAASGTSRVWFTLGQASLTEVYYPDLRHPSARGIDVKVDGRLAAGTATVSQSELAYVQTVTTARWRLTRAYVTDPRRSTLVVRVHFEARDGKPHAVTVAYDPQLYNRGDDDVGWTRGHALLSHDAHIASALDARPAFTDTSSGYAGHAAHLLDHAYDALEQGNVVQAARTTLTGLAHHQDLTLALAFDQTATAARNAAGDSLDAGFDAVSKAYVAGWQAYRATLRPIPAAALADSGEYESSLLVLKASEDKVTPGEFVASPSSSGGVSYHHVRVDDLYQVATALLAAGDTRSANAAVDYAFDHAKPDALAIVLAWQLGRVDRWDGVKPVADALVKSGSATAANIAGLVCAAAIARSNHAERSAAAYEARADAWAGAKLDPKTADPSVLDYVRLGIRRASDPAIVASVKTIDARFRAGSGWSTTSGGLAWPVLTGERGEYELLAGRPATSELAAMAAAADDGGMLPERIAAKPPSATPLAWAHAQFVRLAWSIEAGHPIETPAIVAARYANGTR